MRLNQLHILTALADGDSHGSAITRDVLDQTAGQLRLWPATLYRSLDELAAEGWIMELAGDLHPEGESEKKRYYRLTASGRLALSAEANRLADLAALARTRLRGTQ
jgi:DNA-binding PadR family transcriptional regulator